MRKNQRGISLLSHTEDHNQSYKYSLCDGPFLKEMGLSWAKLVGICTDGGPSMLGSKSGLISHVKQKNPGVIGTHCIIDTPVLAFKTIPKKLNTYLTTV